MKANQPALLHDVKLYFETEVVEKQTDTLEKDHGRIEKREYYLETNIDWLPCRSEWKNLNGIGMVKSSVTSTKTGEFAQESRYFITSITNVEQFAYAVRKHWSIESQLHWQLDVTFHEDASRARKDNSPLNLNILRKQALVLLNQANLGKRVSTRRKISRAAMDNSVLDLILTAKK